MAQKLFSTGPGFKRAKRKETIDDLERTSCDNLQQPAVTVQLEYHLLSVHRLPLKAWVQCCRWTYKQLTDHKCGCSVAKLFPWRGCWSVSECTSRPTVGRLAITLLEISQKLLICTLMLRQAGIWRAAILLGNIAICYHPRIIRITLTKVL